MSEQPESAPASEEQVTGHGAYYPEAAGYQPYNDAMAAWRNQVAAMTASESPAPGPEVVEEPEPQPEVEEASPGAPEPVEDGLGVTEDEEVHGDLFDPAANTAPVVLDYLKAVGEAEADRVLTAEEQGKARLGILNLKDQILARARQNDASTAE